MKEVILLLCLAAFLRATDAQGCSPACQNGGQCLFSLNTGVSSCNCAGTGYSGDVCQTPAGSPADATPSTGQSTSTNVTPAPPPSTTATNQSCPVPCTNGQCVGQYNSEEYTCQCNPGYTGASCSQRSTPAQAPSTNQSCPVPCVHGQCVGQYNSEEYACQCNPGYTGASCSQVSTPAPAPSTNQSCPVPCVNGLCQAQYNSDAYACNCFAGYSGASCNVWSGAIASVPSSGTAGCSNGCYNGECIAYTNGTSRCQCNSGFTGSTCSQRTSVSQLVENSNSNNGSHLSGGAIFGIVLVAFIAALAVAAIGFLLWNRRRRQTFVRYQDENFGTSNVEIGQQKPNSSTSLRFPSS